MSTDTETLLKGTEDAEVELFPGCVVGGRYELIRELGRGAAGVVWLANHSLLASEVAVKFLDSIAGGAQDADFLVERFRFEAQVSARLGKRTDRIVAVHDGGIFQGMPFIVMDFIEGEAVEAMVDRGRLPLAQIATLVRHVADALEAAHQEGIAHRDVKPGNILAVRSGSSLTFKLADFGIAKLFGSAPKGVLPPRATGEQVLVGSPAYMSPETISSSQLSNGAADTWALAVTAYECLTQRLPFEGEAWPNIAVSIVSGRYQVPSLILGGAGARFDAFFTRAFAADVADRFQTPGNLATAFEEIAASDETIAVPPPGESPKRATFPSTTQDSLARDELVIPKSRWGWPAAAAGAAALVLIVGASWLLGGGGPGPTRATTADAGAATTPTPLTKDPAPSGVADAVSVAPGPTPTASASAAPPSKVAAAVEARQPTAQPPVSAPAPVDTPPPPRVIKTVPKVDPSDTQ